MSTERLAEITVILVRETERAILVTDGDLSDAVWLPKSQVEVEEARDGLVDITLPEWLAIERGLV